MLRIFLMVCVLAALAGSVFAEDEVEKDRIWGIGWDNGLTVRRQLGLWQVGVSAGPRDALSDNYSHSFGTDLPDSLQGILSDEEHRRQESGFVRLHLSRELASHRTLVFSGLVSGIYSWADYKNDHSYYSIFSEEYRNSWDESFRQDWDLLLGTRLAWYPVAFLSLETEFGLIYSWDETESERWNKDPDTDQWYREVNESRNQSFQDFGPTSLTYDVQIIVWF